MNARMSWMTVMGVAIVCLSGCSRASQAEDTGLPNGTTQDLREKAAAEKADSTSDPLVLRIRTDARSVQEGDTIKVYVEICNDGNEPLLVNTSSLRLIIYYCDPFLTSPPHNFLSGKPLCESSQPDWVVLRASDYFGVCFPITVRSVNMHFTAYYAWTGDYEAFGVMAWKKQATAKSTVAVRLSEAAKIRLTKRLHECAIDTEIDPAVRCLGTGADVAFLPILIELTEKAMLELGVSARSDSFQIFKKATRNRKFALLDLDRSIHRMRTSLCEPGEEDESLLRHSFDILGSLSWARQYLADHPEIARICDERLHSEEENEAEAKLPTVEQGTDVSAGTADFTILIQ